MSYSPPVAWRGSSAFKTPGLGSGTSGAPRGEPCPAEQLDQLLLPGQLHGAKRLQRRPFACNELVEYRTRDEDRVVHRLRLCLDALCSVHSVADDGVGLACVAAQRSDSELAVMVTDAHAERDGGLDRLGAIELFERSLHSERGPERRTTWMLGGHRSTEDGENSVAHELVDHPALQEDHVAHPLEELVKPSDEHSWVEALAQSGERTEIGEQHGRVDSWRCARRHRPQHLTHLADGQERKERLPLRAERAHLDHTALHELADDHEEGK